MCQQFARVAFDSGVARNRTCDPLITCSAPYRYATEPHTVNFNIIKQRKHNMTSSGDEHRVKWKLAQYYYRLT